MTFLSSGEIGLSEKLGETGRSPRAGQSVRMIEIPADAGAGHRLFEELHGFVDGDALARHLKMAVQRHHGYAISDFLQRIVGKTDGLAQAINAAVEEFLHDHLPADPDGQVSRVARRFALVAAAGEMASTMGILPWPDGEAKRAAGSCFQAWLSRRGGKGPAEILEGVKQVRSCITAHGASRIRGR